MKDLLDFTFQSFWHFIGVFIIITLPFNFISTMTKTLINGANVKRHGWNPNDKKEKQEEDKDETKPYINK
jgi:hypothetical protein